MKSDSSTDRLNDTPMRLHLLDPATGRPRAPDRYDGPMLMGKEAPLRFHVMIKPGGCACNLNCAYCFYLHKADLPGGPGTGRMSDEMLERFIQQYIEGVTTDEVVFTWQGGEPTLLGLDFFRKVVALEKKHAKPGQRIENDLQTNGTLLDEEWCEFLKANRFLVGLSIDGPKKLHDQFRVTKTGQPTFDKVFASAKLLKRFDVPFNTLTCVHRFNARHPLDVYRFLRRELGATYIQFTPIVEYKGFERISPKNTEPNSPVTDWSVDPEDWGYFLCKVFDEWRTRDLGKVMVNHFETLLTQHMGMPTQMCVYGEFCGKGLAVEQDGGIYACDHYVYPEYRIGNVQDGPLADAALSRSQVIFGYAKNETLPNQCRQCPYLQDCWGECPKNRIICTADGEPGLNYLCPGFKKYFEHAIPAIDRIAAELRKRKIRPRPRM